MIDKNKWEGHTSSVKTEKCVHKLSFGDSGEIWISDEYARSLVESPKKRLTRYPLVICRIGPEFHSFLDNKGRWVRKISDAVYYSSEDKRLYSDCFRAMRKDNGRNEIVIIPKPMSWRELIAECENKDDLDYIAVVSDLHGDDNLVMETTIQRVASPQIGKLSDYSRFFQSSQRDNELFINFETVQKRIIK